MKQFKFSCKGKHKCLKQFLAICLALTLLISFQGTGVMATETTGIVSLSVSGVSNFEFDPDETDYTLCIPQTYTNGAADVLDMPTVYIEGADAGIDYPDSVADGEVITVSIDDSVYTLTIDVIGENLYTNGGFEEDGVPMTSATRVTNTLITDNPAGGSYALEHKFSEALSYMSPQPTLESGKTYLFSRMIRKTAETVSADNSVNRPNRILFFMDKLPAGSDVSLTYPDMWSSSTGSYGIRPTEDWNPMTGLITPSADYLDTTGFLLGSWSSSASNVLAMDNCFIGELVVGKIEVTDVSGAGLGKLVKPEEGTDSVSLKAKFYNQLGTTTGLEDMTVSRWELAEAYTGVTLSDSGVLTYDITAPSVVTVRAYGTMGENSPQSEVKGETELILVDPSALVAAELEDITIGGFSIPGYQSSKTSYNIYLPYSYDPLKQKITGNPDVVATPVFEGTTYTVSYPDNLNGGIIEITSTALDDTEKIYRIVVHTVGENFYANSGFEADGIPYSTSASATATKITENPGAGTYSLELSFRGDLQGFVPRATLEADKTYLSSRMIRKTENTVFNDLIPSEDPYFRFDGFSGTVDIYYGDEAIAFQNGGYPIKPADNWKTLNATIKPTVEWEDKQMFHTKGWALANCLALDNCFLGELTVADIEYTGKSRLAIPEQGALTSPLTAKLKNQMGEEFGLLNETVNWNLVYPYQGVHVENGSLIINDEAKEQTIRVRATVQPSFGDGYSIAKSFDIELTSESALAEFPRALNVYADGIVELDEWLEGHYTYHNVKNIAESGTTFEWFYADTETGTQYSTGITTQNFKVTSDYTNKYLFFKVTPRTVEGKVGNTVTSDFLMKPVRPEAINPSIADGGYVGSTATGNYRFVDKNGDAESGSTYRWLRSANPQGPYSAIEDEHGEPYAELTYTVTADDVDKYISFEVTPKSAVAPQDGQPIAGAGILLAARPIVKNVTIHKVNNKVYRVSYDYEHPLNIPQGVCRVQWYTDGSAAGDEISQTISSNVKKLSVTVTPVASLAPYEGYSVTEEINISEKGNVVGSVSGSGGGGGFGFSTSAKPVPVPEIIPEPEVVEPVKHWAADGIEFVLSRGIMQNPEPNDFCNSRLVTRREFIYYVMKTLGFNESAYEHEFEDVSGEDYYAGYLQTAVNEGIISKDVRFNPERNVSRQEITKILVLASGLVAQTEPNLEKFADAVSVSEWARGYVGASVETGLLKGVSETEFFPLGAVTREQTAVILKRLFDYKNGGIVS